MNNPVLILGAGPRLTLTIARSLHRHGIPVIVAPTMVGEPPINSRAIQKHVVLPDFRTKPDEFISILTDLIRTEGVDMIIPTGDGAMAALAQHYETLSRLVNIGSPSPEIMERVLDKNLTLAAAEKCGIPIPKSCTVEDPSKAIKIIEGLRFPVIAKPAIRKGASTFKIRYFATAEDVVESVAEDEALWPGALLQEYVPGVGKGIGILMHEGEPLAMFQHRRVKEYPYTGGVSVVAEAEAVDPTLGDHAVALLREIEWQGIAMVEYRYDPNNGRFALMEINGRYWGSLFLAARAGMDFPFYEWQLAHGQRPEVPKTYKVGQRARWLAGDLMRIHGILDGSDYSEIDPPLRWKEMVRFVSDFGFRTRDAMWTLRDPSPALQEFRRTATALGKADIKKLISTLLPNILLRQIRIYRQLGPKLGAIFVGQQLRRLLGAQKTLFRPDINETGNVLFLCLGNIIRSPTAAHILTKVLADAGKNAVTVESAGLWEGLNRVEPRRSPETVVDVATEFGLSLETHRSQPVTKKLIDASHAIFVMDYQNESMLLSRFPEARHKVFLLGACIEKISPSNFEIADPYGSTAEEIRVCLSTVNDRVRGLARILARQVAPNLTFQPLDQSSNN